MLNEWGNPFKSGLRYKNMQMSNTLQDTDLFSAVSLGALNNGQRQTQKKKFFSRHSKIQNSSVINMLSLQKADS